jgi:hypothetical protein
MIFGSKINHLATLFSLLQLRKMIYGRAPDGKAKSARASVTRVNVVILKIFSPKK